MRIRRNRKNMVEAGGEDSFLDIVANLVGVLIILVVVVGAKAGSELHQVAIEQVDQAELDSLAADYESTFRQVRNLQKDNDDLENKIVYEQQLAATRRAERNQLLVEIGQFQQLLSDRKKELSAEQQVALEKSEILTTLQEKFWNLDSQYTSLKSVATTDETIVHYPTPIAKTVFSDEVHFRLRGGRLVYVPMNELVDAMRDEWMEKARKLEIANETIETVGPIGDFRLQYHLFAEDRTVQTPYGDTTERVTEFTRFVMVPVREQIGVPLNEALLDASEFRNRIDLATPEKTTVSVWVYPDSFEEFNQLKKWLFEKGYKTACWPLSANSPISGGPSGYRSTAQ